LVEKAGIPTVPIRTEAPETPAKSESSAPPPNKNRDRRGQVRHEVDTTATIFLVKVASALRGRIVDLSLGGCRIHTVEKFPVGIYTRVEVEFHLQGFPFRLGGVIQAIHNRNTVGIRLLDLSERKRQQVLDLIDEIEEFRAGTVCEELPLQDQDLSESR
jgi:c-di-GMP-binding flagellar brake protein YcgR